MVLESRPSALLRSTQARVSGLLIDRTWTPGPEEERASPFCYLVPPDEKEAKRTVSFDPAGIKIELLMRVERSCLFRHRSGVVLWGGGGADVGSGGKLELSSCCMSLFLIMSAIAASTSVQHFWNSPHVAR